MMLHAAFNLATGEVIATNRANHLKRRVARNTAWNVAHGYGAGRWIFAHGANCLDKLRAKFEKGGRV